MKRACFIVVLLLWLVGTGYAQDFTDDYNQFKEEAKATYEKYRQDVNKEYAEFMEKAWKSYGIKEPIRMPKRQKLEPVDYDKVKEQKLLLARKKKLQEEQDLLNEKKKEQVLQQNKLAEQEQKQLETQQKLTEEQHKLEEAKKAFEAEQQKFLEAQKQHQKLAEEREEQLAQQLRLLDEKKQQQELDQQRLDENQKVYQQQQQLFNDEKEKREAEQNKLMAENELQQKEALQNLEEEQKKLAVVRQQVESERQKLLEERKKLDQLSDEKEKYLAAQSQQLEEQQRQQLEEKKRLDESKVKDQQHKEARKQLSEEQKKLREEQKLLEKEKNELLAKQKQQQKLFAQQEKQLSEKQQRLDESIKKQKEQKNLLDKERKDQEQQRILLAEEQQRQEKARLQQLEEQAKQLQEEQQKLDLDKKKLEDARLQFLTEKKQQEEELQKNSDAKKKELALQQQQLDENVKKQKAEQQLLDEEKKRQEQQRVLLAEEKSKQSELQKEIEKQKRELEEGRAIEAEIVVVKEDVKPQPQPVAPIKENKEVVTNKSFQFYGTPMMVRWGNADQFKLKGTDKKSISNAYLELTGSKYDNLLHDCLKLRDENNLCDWAYYKMLQDVAEAACGKATNEAVLLQGVLYQQSGYMMRFGLDSNQKLHILSRLNGTVYDCSHWLVEDNVGKRIFFLMDGSRPKQLEVCDVPYPKEQEMSFTVPKLPKLDTTLSDERTIVSRFVSVEAKCAVNKNMINFFNDYPASFRDNDVTTRWPYYANAPVTKEIKEKLYPQLRKHIGNATKLMAANMLLNWIQMGFDYAADEKVWGVDRAFFVEETLFYPLCDCEDRSILFSRLVRDLLDLDVVMVYYPNNPQHMYTAVCFDEDVKGDYIMVDGRKFTIADPTCYNANVGHTMNQMDNSKARVIPLKRDGALKSL